jgi:hypothetical protein
VLLVFGLKEQEFSPFVATLGHGWVLDRYGEFGELERGESLLIAVRKVSGVVPCPAIQGVQVSSCGVCVHWS